MKVTSIKNPFFKVGKVIGKFGKYAGLSIAGMAAVAGMDHFVELLPVLIGTFGQPWSGIIMLIVGGSLAGGAGAVRNWQKNVHIDKDKLAEILAEVWEADDAVGTLRKKGLTDAQAFKFLQVLVKNFPKVATDPPSKE